MIAAMFDTIATQGQLAYVRLWQLSKQGRPCSNGLLLSVIGYENVAETPRTETWSGARQRPSLADDDVFRDSRTLITRGPDRLIVHCWGTLSLLAVHLIYFREFPPCTIVHRSCPLLRISVFKVPSIDDDELWRNDLTSLPRGVRLRKRYYSAIETTREGRAYL